MMDSLKKNGSIPRSERDLSMKILDILSNQKPHIASYIAKSVRKPLDKIRDKLWNLVNWGVVQKQSIIFGGKKLWLYFLEKRRSAISNASPCAKNFTRP